MVLDITQRSVFPQAVPLNASFPYELSDSLPGSEKQGTLLSYQKAPATASTTSSKPDLTVAPPPNDYSFDFDALFNLYTAENISSDAKKQSAASEGPIFGETKTWVAPADVPSHSKSNQASHDKAMRTNDALDVCPDPGCPHCLAIELFLQQNAASSPNTNDFSSLNGTGAGSTDFPEMASPQSHMDISHGTPGSGGAPSPPSNPISFLMEGSDDLREFFSKGSTAGKSGNGTEVSEDESSSSKRDNSISPPPISFKSKWKSSESIQKDSVLSSTVGKSDAITSLSHSKNLVQVLTAGPQPPPAYKLPDSDPLARDKIHLGNGMSLTEREVVDMPVHELNRLLYQSKLTEAEISLIKETRRRGKNKVAARNCRKRKMDTISELEKEVEELKCKKEKLSNERDLLARELEIYKSKTESLTRFILEKVNGSSGLKLNVDQLTLEKAEDGRLFIVPNLDTTLDTGSDENHVAQLA